MCVCACVMQQGPGSGHRLYFLCNSVETELFKGKRLPRAGTRHISFVSSALDKHSSLPRILTVIHTFYMGGYRIKITVFALFRRKFSSSR